MEKNTIKLRSLNDCNISVCGFFFSRKSTELKPVLYSTSKKKSAVMMLINKCLRCFFVVVFIFSQLLNRVFNIMREKNPDMVAGEKRKFVMKPPQVVRVGTKKTSFVNFTDICKL